jgi:hypothetical protein
MVVFDAKLDYVLKDLLGVPIDTKTNPTRLAFEEEAIHSWWKFIKLPASFIDDLRYLENNIPKYPAKSIIMELQSIKNFRHHLIQTNDVNANNPQSWDTLLYVNWVAYDEQSFLAGTTAVTTTTFNSNSGVTSLTKIKHDHTKFDKMVNDDIKLEEESSISEGAIVTDAASAMITQLDFPDENKKRTMVAATVRTTVVDGKGIPVENTPPRPPPPSNACIENNDTEDSGTRPLNQEAEATASASTKSTIATTTVVDGEVIPVETTSTRPPPLPEPPPSSNNFIENNNEDSQRRLHSILPTDGEIFLMIQVLLLRSMYRIPARNDNGDNKDDDNIADVHEEDKTIAIVMQLVALYQVKCRMNCTVKDIQDTNFVNNNILSMTKFCQTRYFVNDKNFADADDNNILSMTKFCQPRYFVSDNFSSIMQQYKEKYYLYHDGTNGGIDRDTSTDGEILLVRLMHQAQVKVQAKFPQVQVMDRRILLLLQVQVMNPPPATVPATAPATDRTSQSTTTMMIKTDTDRIDTDINDDNDTVNMSKIVLFQIKYKRNWPTTTIDEVLILFTYRVDRMYRVNTVLSSIVLLLQSGSVQYDDDNTIAIEQQVALFQDKYHTIAVVSSLDRNGEYYFVISKDTLTNTTKDQIESFSNDNHNVHDDDDNTVLYQDVHNNRYGYSTTTLQPTLSSIGPLDDDTFAIIYWYTYIGNNDAYNTIDSTLTHPFDVIKNNGNRWYNNNNNNNNITIDSTLIQSFDLIKDDGYFSTSINGEKYTNQSKYKDNYIKCQAPATISTTTTAARYKYLYRMKLTPTTEDSSSTNSKTEDRIDLDMTIISCNNNSSNYRYNNGIVIMIRILTCLHTLISTTQIGENKNIDGMEKIGEYQSRALRSEGQYKDEVYNAEEGMFQEPITINNSTYSNIANIGIVDYCNDTRKENGEQTTCYSGRDPYMIQYCTNTIAIEATLLRLGHCNEGKIDINTRINNINNNYWYNNNDETTTLISIGDETTCTSIGDKATTLIRTIQNGEKHNRLDYNMVLVLIYDHVISMIPVQLCSCILLIVTMRLLSQSMGSVKIHKDRVLKLI